MRHNNLHVNWKQNFFLQGVWRKLNTGIEIRKCDLRNFPLSIFPMNAADFLRKTPSVTSQSIPSSLEMDVCHFTCIPRDILCHSSPSERMSIRRKQFEDKQRMWFCGVH
ncbi:hypothetical protein CEXT_698171 [Caerostris extrusa]|uniref:Uncharacterized protein n=1 Tax=Caerostris extrusa TaxID=172846 RepID=A0AAV4S1E8_CAEEX|nr:hypothetical protein CEXT_698171 [Caerostris extrusa]